MARVSITCYASDFNGNPLSGAKLFIYDAGTTDLHTVYRDSTNATNHTNPVVCNAGGNEVVWVDDGSDVKIVLKDSTETTTYYSQDNIDPAANPTGILIYPGAQGDQSLSTTDSPTFAGLTLTGNLTGTTATFSGDLTVNANIITTGTVDGVDVAQLESDFNDLPSGIDSLTVAEVAQLQNIDSTTISAAQWVYVGAADQGTATTDSVTFAELALATALPVSEGGTGATTPAAARVELGIDPVYGSYADTAAMKAITTGLTAGDVLRRSRYATGHPELAAHFRVLSGGLSSQTYTTERQGIYFETTDQNFTFELIHEGEIDARHAGAIADGSTATDSEPACQAVNDYFEERGGGDIILPAEDNYYTFDSTLTISGAVSFSGTGQPNHEYWQDSDNSGVARDPYTVASNYGTVIWTPASTTGDVIQSKGSNDKGVTIKNLTIDLRNAGAGAATNDIVGVRDKGSWAAEISKVHVVNLANNNCTGIYSDNTTATAVHKITQCFVGQNTGSVWDGNGDGISTETKAHVNWDTCWVRKTNNGYTFTAAGGNNRLIDCTAENVTTTALSVTSGAVTCIGAELTTDGGGGTCTSGEVFLINPGSMTGTISDDTVEIDGTGGTYTVNIAGEKSFEIDPAADGGKGDIDYFFHNASAFRVVNTSTSLPRPQFIVQSNFTGGSQPEYSWSGDDDTGIYRIGPDQIGIATGGTQGLRVDASQDVTIPNGNLTVSSGTTTLGGNLDVDGNEIILDADGDTSLRETADDVITMKVAGTDTHRYHIDGAVSFGTTTAVGRLNLLSPSAACKVQLGNSTSATNVYFQSSGNSFQIFGGSSSTEAFKVDGSGDLVFPSDVDSQGTTTLATTVQGGAFLPTSAEETIATGAIPAPTSMTIRLDTEADAATDDLDTIGDPGAANEDQIVILRIESGARIPTVKHATGNIRLSGGSDFALSNSRSRIMLQWQENISSWVEISRSANT